jgi:hypothetical protein
MPVNELSSRLTLLSLAKKGLAELPSRLQDDFDVAVLVRIEGLVRLGRVFQAKA